MTRPFDAAALARSLAANNFAAEFDAATLRLPRPERTHYLGMSSMGKCQAQLWRHFHGVQKPLNVEPRIQRIFDLGHVIEDLVMQIMGRMDGYELLSTQAEYSDFDGKMRGHSDAVLSTPDYSKVVGDVKSMKDSKFKQFQDLGLRRAFWDYYVQLQMYAGYEQGTEAVLLVAYNKDTSEVHPEYVPVNSDEFKLFRAKAELVLTSAEEPPCERGNGRVQFCNCRRKG